LALLPESTERGIGDLDYSLANLEEETGFAGEGQTQVRQLGNCYLGGILLCHQIASKHHAMQE